MGVKARKAGGVQTLCVSLGGINREEAGRVLCISCHAERAVFACPWQLTAPPRAVCAWQVADKQSYTITVQPGVDAAFIVALAMLCDEFHHDQQK